MAPYAASIEESRRKLQYDLYYIKHMSFFLDTYIIIKTIKTILFGRERHPLRHAAKAHGHHPTVVKTQTLVFDPTKTAPVDPAEHQPDDSSRTQRLA
jgi:hypothetical protein